MEAGARRLLKKPWISQQLLQQSLLLQLLCLLLLQLLCLLLLLKLLCLLRLLLGSWSSKVQTLHQGAALKA
jgi:hypothetical protein